MEQVFLGLGSNQDGPLTQLQAACAWLSQHPAIQFCQASPVYQSPAMVLPGADASAVADYLNIVVELTTAMTAEQLLAAIKEQEQRQGRDLAAQRWSSRPIDIDILLFGRQQLHNPQLQIPHIGISERDFVLLPWRDISPNTDIPGLGTVADCASALATVSAFKRYDSLPTTSPS